MADTLRFHPHVVHDLTDAAGWYDDRSPGLGDRFRAAVDGCFDAIERNPERFGFAFDDFRCAKLSRFPYVVVFRLHAETVYVVGVFHAASDPAKWRRQAR